jgi:hypothetical protein
VFEFLQFVAFEITLSYTVGQEYVDDRTITRQAAIESAEGDLMLAAQETGEAQIVRGYDNNPMAYLRMKAR